MTKITTKVPTEKGLVDQTGYLMEIVEQKEPWAEYKLEDGATIRMRQTIVQITKLDEVDPMGNPVYSIQAQPIINIIPPQK